MKNQLTKCDFCKYFSGSSCMVTQNKINCKQASDEFFNYLKEQKDKINKKRFDNKFQDKKRY